MSRAAASLPRVKKHKRDEAMKPSSKLDRAGTPAVLRRAGACTVIALLAFGCKGDTLYESDPANVRAPTVSIVDPTAGQQVQSGRVVRVRIAASDSLGVTEVEVSYRGVANGSIRIPISPPRTNVVVDTSLVLPAGATGSLELQVSARNGLGGIGRSDAITLDVSSGDLLTPFVAITSTTPARMELTDSIRVRVTARDNSGGSGIARVGVTAVVTFAGTTGTQAIERSASFTPPRTNTVIQDFAFPVPFIDPRQLPRIATLEYHAFAVDSAGNCAANTLATESNLACATLDVSGGSFTVGTSAATPATTTVVAGRSILLPVAAIVPDAAVDLPRERLYLSSLTASRIEVLNLRTQRFESSVLVGSQPWGVHINRTGDSLIVANSGGTNLSYVTLSGTPTEAVSRRVRTPNSNVFEISQIKDGGGFIRYDITFHDFSDRPQFIAQDVNGRLLYSTQPTPAAPDGTIRIATNEPGWQQPEVRLLMNELVTFADSLRFSVVHVDSMRVFTSPAANDVIEIYDHVNGFPNQIISSGRQSLAGALDSLANHPQSDIIFAPGRFALQLVGLRDTTFVAASGDRQRIMFGEGARNPGRIIMWDAATADISNEITIADLVGNASERVTGIALNLDGTFNAARGQSAAYFFREDLRLQGHAAAAASGAAGAQLHPEHPSYVSFPPSGASTLAFVAAGTSIRIFDTVHFSPRGEIEIRDAVSGPLRVSRPLAGETTGCPGTDCIIAKLYGVTSAGAVVVVDVRTRDVR
jgi:hypothetical protein